MIYAILSFQETELLRYYNLASLCSLGEEKERERVHTHREWGRE